MTRNSKLREAQGFTLIEIMIVVFILGILALIALPAFNSARANARTTSFASDIRTLTYAAECYGMETGLWAPATSAGAFPAEFEGYISQKMYEADTSLGGGWKIVFDGGDFYSGVGVANPTYPAEHFEMVDKVVDDGDLSTGQFIASGDGYYFIIEEL